MHSGRVTKTAAAFSPVLLLCLVAGAPDACAQSLPVRHWDLSARFDSYIHESWDTEQGLPDAVVNAIAQTPDGYIWLGTQSGLVRFNGIAFLTFDRYNTPAMKNEFVRRLAVDRDSALWVATDHGGILSIRGGTVSASRPGDSVGADAVRVILTKTDGSVLASIPGEGVWYRGPPGDGGSGWKREVLLRPLTSVWAAWEDPDASTWLGENGALVHVTAGSEVWYGSSLGVPNAQVSCILRDKRGDLLFGSRQGGVYVLRNGRAVRLAGAAPLSRSTVTCMCGDQAGGIWIGTGDAGLWYYDGTSVSRCMSGRGTSPLLVGSLMLDNQGNIWFGTHGDGLNRLRRSVVRYLSVAEPGVSSQVWSVATHGDEMWIGTRGSGVRRYAGGRMVRLPMPENLSTMTVGALLREPDGTLWIGGETGLFKTGAGGIAEVFMPDGRPFANPFGMLRDHAGKIWIGGEGLFTSEGGRMRAVSALPPGVSVNAFLEGRDGKIWIATDANGVGCLDGEKIEFYSTDRGLSSNTVLCLYEDQEECIWAGTQGGGLCRLRSGRWRSLTTSGGLLNNYVNTIIRADDGDVWMSTNGGLFGTSERSVIDATEGKIRVVEGVSIEARDGLRSTEFGGGLQSCVAKSPDGTLWFASVKGLVGYNPRTLTNTPPPPPPPVRIEQVSINGRRTDFYDGVRFGPGVRSVSFDYVGLSFVVPAATRYRYYLEGYEEEWIDGHSEHQASYTNLPPGAYVFHVTAANSEGAWNPTGIALRFMILPLFWQTALFRALCILVFLGTCFGAYRLRVWQILAREKKLRIRVEEALAKIKVLHGLIPICANCKKIRDDRGYWNDLAQYIREHSGAVLSHGICPECMEELYGPRLRDIREQKAKRTPPV